ncbi:MAG: BatD family protein [Planctomycetota bacterium]
MSGFAGEALVRTNVSPIDSVALGQRAVMTVDVLAEESWARLPTIPALEVSGAIVYVPPNQSVRLSETIRGASYTGQRYEWWIYPRRMGELTIPAIELQIEERTFGAESESESSLANTRKLTLNVMRPDGMPLDKDLLVTKSFRATQAWSDRSEVFIVGDGVRRTISRTAVGVPSLMIPPMEFQQVDGIRNYLMQPETDNAINRGELTCERIDVVTYVFEEPGVYELPDESLAWFDPETGETRHKILEGLSVTVELPTVSAEEASDRVESRSDRGFAGSLAAIVLISGLAVIVVMASFRERSRACWKRYLAKRQSSEWYRYRRFRFASRASTPAAALRELTKWSDTVQSHERAPRLDRLIHRYGTPEDQKRLHELHVAVDQSPADWSGSALRDAITSVRRTLREQSNDSKRRGSSVLPPLGEMKSKR